jgi:hypothetical protein
MTRSLKMSLGLTGCTFLRTESVFLPWATFVAMIDPSAGCLREGQILLLPRGKKERVFATLTKCALERTQHFRLKSLCVLRQLNGQKLCFKHLLLKFSDTSVIVIPNFR